MAKNGYFWAKIVDFWAFFYIVPNTLYGKNNINIYIILV